MSKKIILFFVSFIFFSCFHFAFANLTINEIMYDLSGSDSINNKSREWIEIYNPDSSDVSVDASKWRIYDGSANRTINDQVNFVIPSGAYIIFAGDKDTFLADHLNFSVTVYDTGITSLSNTGATLKLLNQDGSVVDSVTYLSSLGASGNGNSLQLINGSWFASTPTPGTLNQNSQPSLSSGGVGLVSDYSDNNSSQNVTTINTTTKNTIPEENKNSQIKTQIITKSFAFVGLPTSFQANSYGLKGEKLYFGKYFWNFGDGDFKEMSLSDSQPFTHTYFYGGDYTVSLDYYSTSYQEVPDTSSQINIKIIPADISISRVGDEKDFFIELTNKTNYNADLSNWILSSDSRSFVLPKNTILASNKAIIISPRISNFSIADKSSLKLMNPQKEIVFDYSPPLQVITSSNVVADINTINETKTVAVVSKASQPLQKNSETKIPINLSPKVQNLTATVVSSGVENKNNSNGITIFIIFFVFICASAVAVYYIRAKKSFLGVLNSSKKINGDEFEILDE